MTSRRVRAIRAFRPGTAIAFVAALAVIGAIAGIEFYALYRHGRAHSPDPAATAVAHAGTIGNVETPTSEGVIGPEVKIAGWALDPAGIRAVEIRAGDRRFLATIGITRPDVARVHPDFPDSARAGFEFAGDFTSLPAPPGVDRRTLIVVAIAKDGRETTLATKSLIEPAALSRWQSLANPSGSTPTRAPFHILPALSAIGLGGALELDDAYTPYLSETMRIGMRVPILYLRTTRGAADDYAFDPDWDIERRCGARRISEDSLGTTIAHAIERKLPVLFTLNGGIWADAACDVPGWDINDKLEEDRTNCQWNEKNEVMPDDYLKHLPGSMDAPELGRSLTFNVYAQNVRHYKRRNLQAAATIIAAFAGAHPDLFVGITLDADTYLNPFFEQQQWYDYNPGTLRQFRHWLRGTGPYAGAPDEPGVPDLRAYRRPQALTLGEVRRLAGRHFSRWDDVDPPRAFPREPKDGRPAFWGDPWTREWETFRRHLVDLHYDELSQWAKAAGVSRDRIWSAQGFMAPGVGARPFANRVASPMKNYDTGGMSVQGAVPSDGHLGAILYGAAAANDVPMEESPSLFATFRALDPGWAAVEINTADLRHPKALPTYASAYRVLANLFNYGARYLSPMAWNGSNGADAGKPGYATFTAWRNTPFEEAARDFLLSHANVPLGARLWTFGTPRHADADGWTADAGAIATAPGFLALEPADGRVTLISPRELALAPGAHDRLVLGLAGAAPLVSLRAFGRGGPDVPWRKIAAIGEEGSRSETGPEPKPGSAAPRLQTTPAGVVVSLAPAAPGRGFDQIRLELQFAAGAAPLLTHVALLPSAAPAKPTPR